MIDATAAVTDIYTDRVQELCFLIILMSPFYFLRVVLERKLMILSVHFKRTRHANVLRPLIIALQ